MILDPEVSAAQCRAGLAKMKAPDGGPLSAAEIDRQTSQMMMSWGRYFGAEYERQQRSELAKLKELIAEQPVARLNASLAAGISNTTIVSQDLLKADVTTKPVIVAAPGARVAQALQFVFSKKTFDRVFAQVLIDGREEIFEAMSNGLRAKAIWRHIALYLLLIQSLLSQTAVSILKKIHAVWTSLGGE